MSPLSTRSLYRTVMKYDLTIALFSRGLISRTTSGKPSNCRCSLRRPRILSLESSELVGWNFLAFRNSLKVEGKDYNVPAPILSCVASPLLVSLEEDPETAILYFIRLWRPTGSPPSCRVPGPRRGGDIRVSGRPRLPP